jgi:hypothetical protein
MNAWARDASKIAPMLARNLGLGALASMVLAGLGCSSAAKRGPDGAPPVAPDGPLEGEPMSLRFRPRSGVALWVSGQFTPFDVELVGGPARLERSSVWLSCTTADPRGTHGIGIWAPPPGAVDGELSNADGSYSRSGFPPPQRRLSTSRAT